MSRREMALNVILGAGLLVAFYLPVALLWVSGRLFVHALSLGLAHIYPAAANLPSELFDFLIFPALTLLAAYDAMRWKRWRVFFLNFALAAILSLIYVHQFHSGIRFDPPFPVLFVFILSFPVALPRKQDLSRNRFLLFSAFLCVAATSALGLLGSGSLAQTTNFLLNLMACGWIVLLARRGGVYADESTSIAATSTPPSSLMSL